MKSHIACDGDHELNTSCLVATVKSPTDGELLDVVLYPGGNCEAKRHEHRVPPAPPAAEP
jgi:hypothetical protein